MDFFVKLAIVFLYAIVLKTGVEIFRYGLSPMKIHPAAIVFLSFGLAGIMLTFRKDSRRRWIIGNIFMMFLMPITIIVTMIVFDYRFPIKMSFRRVIVTCREDARLGYAPIPNSTSTPLEDGEIFHFDDRGERLTPHQNRTAEKTVYGLGCSMLFGYGVKDNETCVDLLQKKFRNVEFRNGAVTGYGTVQCLIRLQDAIQRGERFSSVVYGFISDHALRNCRREARRKIMMECWPKLPYGKMVGETLIIMPPAGPESNLPGSTEMVDEEKQVTIAAIKEMKDLCDAYRSSFAVVFLPEKDKSSEIYPHEFFEEELGKRGIKVINLWSPNIPPEDLLPADGFHYSALGHRRIAHALARNPIFLSLVR
jgi:lysophospholipase L1-like esterase